MSILYKYIHVSCVLLSFTGFFVRGVWMMTESPMLHKAWVKVAPHIIDTLLLISAVLLAIDLRQYPGTHAWLTAKVVGLLAYIVLGTIGLKRGPTKNIRIAAWAMALLVFIYVVAVAMTRSAGLRLL